MVQRRKCGAVQQALIVAESRCIALWLLANRAHAPLACTTDRSSRPTTRSCSSTRSKYSSLSAIGPFGGSGCAPVGGRRRQRRRWVGGSGGGVGGHQMQVTSAVAAPSATLQRRPGQPGARKAQQWTAGSWAASLSRLDVRSMLAECGEAVKGTAGALTSLQVVPWLASIKARWTSLQLQTSRGAAHTRSPSADRPPTSPMAPPADDPAACESMDAGRVLRYTRERPGLRIDQVQGAGSPQSGPPAPTAGGSGGGGGGGWRCQQAEWLLRAATCKQPCRML